MPGLLRELSIRDLVYFPNLKQLPVLEYVRPGWAHGIDSIGRSFRKDTGFTIVGFLLDLLYLIRHGESYLHAIP